MAPVRGGRARRDPADGRGPSRPQQTNVISTSSITRAWLDHPGLGSINRGESDTAGLSGGVVGGGELVGLVTHSVYTERVGGSRDTRRRPGDDDYQVALDDSTDLQQGLIDLADHLVGVFDGLRPQRVA